MFKHGNPAKKLALQQLVQMMDEMEGEGLKKGPGATVTIDVTAKKDEESPEHEATESPEFEAGEDEEQAETQKEEAEHPWMPKDEAKKVAADHLGEPEGEETVAHEAGESPDVETSEHSADGCTDEGCPVHGVDAKVEAFLKKVHGKKK